MKWHNCTWLGSYKDKLVLEEMEISTGKKHFSNYPILLTFKALNKIKSLVFTTFKVMKGEGKNEELFGISDFMCSFNNFPLMSI